MVNKITTPPTQNEVIDKINELVDDKQDNLVSGTNIKTVNNTSLLGGGNISIPVITVDSALSTTSTNAVQNRIVTTALNGKIDGYNINVAGNWTGGAHAVNFITFDYTDCNSENGIFIKLSMVNSHGNGITGRFFQDVILNCSYTGVVAGTIYRYFAEHVESTMSYSDHNWGDIFWTIDTTNKIVKFYVLMRQYSYTYMTPYFRLNASTKGVINQKSGAGQEEYGSGTQYWASINWYETDQTYNATSPKPQSGVAVASAISGKANSADLATVATTGSYNDLSNKPTVDQTYSAISTNAQSGVAIAGALSEKQNILNAGSNIQIESTLPSGYTQLEYIESTGSKSILTGVIPTNSTGIYIKVDDTGLSQQTEAGYFVGAQTQSKYMGYFTRHPSSSLVSVWCWNGEGVIGNDIQTTTTEIFINYLNDRKYVYKGSSTYTVSNNLATLDTGVVPLVLFAINMRGNNSSYYGKGKLYFAKITEGSTLVRDFIPAKRNSDSVIGLYDRVTNEFYTERNSNNFTGGSEINTSDTISAIVPATTSSVTSGSTAALTSGGAYTALQSYQTTANLVTTVSSSSTNAQYPSAKLFYDTCGDIETLINAL